MNLSRRSFLAAAGSSVASALAGCDRVPPFLAGPDSPADGGAFQAPRSEAIDDVVHAINRLTYGPRPGDYARVASIGVDTFIDEQLAPESIDDAACDALARRFEELRLPAGELFEYKEDVLRRDLTHRALVRAIYSRRQLQEVMVEFWTDHFNIDISKGDCPWLKACDDREVIRRHALGRFPAMLKASALSPAMLWYLDGRSNRRCGSDDRPNENYARELLELHTLGVHGGYSQRDVMEVARCLTGWTVRSDTLFGKGRIEFDASAHDGGEKSVLGHTIPAGLGEGDLDRVLSILVAHPSTARHLASKLCRRFIGPDDYEQAVATVAGVFHDTQGDIPAALRTLFGTTDFWNARATVFKRPYRFVVSALRASNAKLEGMDGVYEYLERMGHAPYQYPTPDGYPEDAHHWYGSMLWRWHFALALAENRLPGVHADWESLARGFENRDAVVRHLLGRAPTASEKEAYAAVPAGAAVVLGAPAFQWC